MSDDRSEAQLIEYLWRVLQLSRSQVARCRKHRNFSSLQNVLQQNPMGLISELKIQSSVVKQVVPHLGAHPSSGELYITCVDPSYPEKLTHLNDPPYVLYYRGNLEGLSHSGPRITMVGTRQASSYAKKVCEKLLEQLAPWDPLILSGMAGGIDGIVHEGALRLGLKTVGVLGTPLHRPYPSFHHKLFKEMEQKALLLTEVYPEAVMGPWRFPERNRLLAALADATVVVEAPEQSGSLSTAKEAVELGREVFIVPGPILPDQNRGGHRLIQEGAHLMTHGEEIIEVLGFTKCRSKSNSGLTPSQPSKILAREKNQKPSKEYQGTPEAQALLALFQGEAMQIDKIIHISQKPASVVSTLLMDLNLEGWIEELPGGYFQLNQP